MRRLFLVILIFYLAGCAGLAGPEYKQPVSPVKEGWSLNAGDPSKGQQVIKIDWWKEFKNPYLDGLIEKAISNSITIQIAAARTAEAKAGITRENAGRLPILSLGTSITGGVQGQFGGPLPATSDTFIADHASTSLSWEIDFWGKLKKGVLAQTAVYKASEADWRSVWLSIVSEVASKYFLVRQFDEQIKAQQQALAAAKEILAIYVRQLEAGLRTRSELMLQQAEINFLQSQLLEFERKRAVTQNELASLLGIPAGDFRVPVADLQQVISLPDVPIGLPSDLLSRRPDIVAAEYNVLAQHELLGKARLEKLPSIALTADGGMNNLLSAALSNAIKTWTFGIGPSVSIPIFDPSIEANIKVREAQQVTAEAIYRQTVVTAFQEVENALVNLLNHKEQRKELESRAQQIKAVAEITLAGLREGEVTQLQVFEVQRTLLQASLLLLENHQQLLFDTITLYKALGGGWPVEHVSPQELEER
jgi:multidrug efflux system outer membrane protein